MTYNLLLEKPLAVQASLAHHMRSQPFSTIYATKKAYTRYREAQNLTSTQVTSTFLSRHCSKNKRHYSLPLPPAYISPKPARSNFGFYRDINLQSSVGETAPKHTKYSRVKPFRDIAVCRWLPDYRVCSLSHYPVLSVCFQIA